MESISAIVAVMAAGADEAQKPTAVQAVTDAYAGFKALVIRRFSKTATPLQAIEEKPASETRRRALEEELADAGADRDSEVLTGFHNLVAALDQHAPQSIANIAASVGGGVNVESGRARSLSNPSGGVTTIRSDGGSVIQGPVTTGGGTFVGRDQIINNITVHTVDQILDLTAVLRESIGRLGVAPEPDALDDLEVVLDEISKLYQLIDTEFTRYLSLSFDDPQQVLHDRAVLLSLDGGLVAARATEARGHCEKINRIYRNRLRGWFSDRLDAQVMTRVDRAFGMLGASDVDMTYAIHQLALWLSGKASQTLNLVDAGDLAGARRLVKDARLDSHGMRQKLASTISTMRDIQAELLSLAP